jgi:hypothetical protein
MELVAADEQHNGNICPMWVIMIESGNSRFSKKERGKYPRQHPPILTSTSLCKSKIST